MMDILIGKFALITLCVYMAFSVMCALRMYFVHNIYVHVEYSQKKWHSFGQWAPRQYRRLRILRAVALLLIVVWLAAVIYSAYKQ
jgi:type VI protein secretion system component VasK